MAQIFVKLNGDQWVPILNQSRSTATTSNFFSSAINIRYTINYPTKWSPVGAIFTKIHSSDSATIICLFTRNPYIIKLLVHWSTLRCQFIITEPSRKSATMISFFLLAIKSHFKTVSVNLHGDLWVPFVWPNPPGKSATSVYIFLLAINITLDVFFPTLVTY